MGTWRNLQNGTSAVSAAVDVASLSISWPNDIKHGSQAIFVVFACRADTTIPTPGTATDPQGNTWTSFGTTALLAGSVDGASLYVYFAPIFKPILSTDVVTLPYANHINNSYVWASFEYVGIRNMSFPNQSSGIGQNVNQGTAVQTNNSAFGTTEQNQLCLRIYGDLGYNVNWTAAPLGTPITNIMNNLNAELWISEADSGPLGSITNTTGTLSGTGSSYLAIVMTLFGQGSREGTYEQNTASKVVGPRVKRKLFHRPIDFWATEALPDPQNTYVPPIQIANTNVGPMALRRLYHRRFVNRGIDTVAGTFNDFVLAAASLAFTGPTNLGLNVSKVLAGTLSFTGVTNLFNAITKGLAAAILSFTGPTNLLKATTKNLVTGVLSFTGSSAQKIIFNKVLAAATLTFTGPTNLLLSVGKRVTGILSFTGPTNLLKAVTKGVAGTLSFTGPTNLLKATTKVLAAATLSFTGSIKKAVSKFLATGTLSFTGALATARAFLWSLAGTLSFTGPTNLLKSINKNLTVAVLSFTGPTNLLKATTKNLVTAALSFTGAIRRSTSKFLTTAVLSFTGSITRQTGKILSGILSFTGAIASNKAFLWAMTAALTFTGPTNLLKSITKGLTVAVLSFNGTTIKSTVKQTFTGILSFTGAMAKLPKKALTATLTFTGTHVFNNVFVRALAAATLSFTGAITKKTSKSLVTAVLSFTGPTNLLKSIGKGITGGLSFTGALLRAIKVSMTTGVLSFTGSITKKTSKFLVTAVLSFTGAFTKAIIFLKVLVTAVLSFTGPTNLLKNVGKQVSGGLSFTGITNLPKAITKGIAGALSFTGSIVKKTSKFISGVLSFTGGFTAAIPSHFTDFILAAANLTFTGTRNVAVGKFLTTGTLSFVGSIKKSTSKALTAILSFTGVNVRAFPKLLTATLTFTGSITRQAGKRLTGVLSFTGPANLKKAIGKMVQATLTFTTGLLFPGRFGLAKIGIQLDSQPMVIDIAVTETLPFVVDISNYIQAGDAIGAKYASLINAATGNPVTVQWHNPITMSGNLMTIPILGSTLNLGQRYQMTVVFTLSSVKYATFITYLNVVA